MPADDCPAGTSTIRFALLGPLEVTGPDGPVMITGPKERIVLTVLAAWAGEVVSIDRLTDALWADRPPPSDVKVIRNLVSQLRRVLGATAIETQPTGYVLRAAPDAVDARRFDSLLQEGRRHAASGRWQAGADALAAAAALWRGSPLEALGEWSPGRTEAARLEEQHRCLVEEWAEAELACGHHHDVVGRLAALVEAEPLRERRWSMLMQALYRCGRQAEALRAFERARTALAELGLEPGPELAAMERDVSLQVDRSPAPPEVEGRSSPGNLPKPATELVGRVTEVQERVAELSLHRLVTLTGAGGVGKTRLAIEVAWSLVEDFPGGVWMVELAPVGGPDAVVPTMASMLSVQPRRGLTMEQSIVESVRDRHLLLVFDNCEHVLAPVTRLVEALLSDCPGVTVLTTSREPLGIPGEWVHEVPSLDPATEGVELFCDRAVAADSTFTPNDEDRLAITAICRRVDGMPLAIELAAARIRASSPAVLLSRLDDRFRLLRRNGRGGPPRHQTLRSTVDWSYELLSEDERVLFDRLSVFAGGFDLAAADAVCCEGLDPRDIAGMLDSLVAKSMVIVDRSSHGVRYRLLETLRQYGHERLQVRAEADVLRDRLLRHYLSVASRARTLWAGPRQLEAHTIFDQAWDNLRAAHAWTVATTDLASADALVAATGPHAWCRLRHEHGDWVAQCLALGTADRPANPATFGWASFWMFIAGSFDQAIDLAHRGIEVADPDDPDTIWCWSSLAWTHSITGRPEAATSPARHARDALGGLEDPFARAWAHTAVIEHAVSNEGPTLSSEVSRYAEFAKAVGAPSLLAEAAFYRGQDLLNVQPARPADALAAYTEGLGLARMAGDIHSEGKNLIGVIVTTGFLKTPEAVATAHEALQRLYDNRHRALLVIAVETVAGLLFLTTNPEAGAVAYGHIDAHHPVYGGERAKRNRAAALRRVAEQPGADQLMERGAAMTTDQIVTFVLDELARQASAAEEGADVLA